MLIMNPVIFKNVSIHVQHIYSQGILCSNRSPGLSVKCQHIHENQPSLCVFQAALCQSPQKLQMFPKSCWKADKESAFNGCLVLGLSDLVAVNDETVFQCLRA